MAALLIRDPGQFDVIVTTNMFGDILSDEASESPAASASAPRSTPGDRYAVAQAQHGSAPDIAGKDVANPSSLIEFGGHAAVVAGKKRGPGRTIAAAGRCISRRSTPPSRRRRIAPAISADRSAPRPSRRRDRGDGAANDGATELNPPFSVLRHPPVLLLWVSRVASMIAFQMQGVAFGWQMYAITSSPLDLGLIGLFQFVPAAALSLVAGQVADRYDRSLVLRLAQTVEAIAALIMLVATARGVASKEWILAAAFIVGSARAFEGTAFQTVLPVIVPPGQLARAIAALASAQQIATIGGPALGGAALSVRADAGLQPVLRPVPRRRRMHAVRQDRRARRRSGSRSRCTACSPGSATSSASRSFSAPSRSTCLPCCSAARSPCCRRSPATSTGPDRGEWGCCAPRPRSARW